MDFDVFFRILIFDPKSGFCMGYSFCMMADFQNALISLHLNNYSFCVQKVLEETANILELRRF